MEHSLACVYLPASRAAVCLSLSAWARLWRAAAGPTWRAARCFRYHEPLQRIAAKRARERSQAEAEKKQLEEAQLLHFYGARGRGTPRAGLARRPVARLTGVDAPPGNIC